jgi:hypothetical protein
MILTGEIQRTWREVCLIATASTTNPTCTDPGRNLSLHNVRSATNCLTHGMAHATNLPLQNSSYIAQ